MTKKTSLALLCSSLVFWALLSTAHANEPAVEVPAPASQNTTSFGLSFGDIPASTYPSLSLGNVGLGGLLGGQMVPSFNTSPTLSLGFGLGESTRVELGVFAGIEKSKNSIENPIIQPRVYESSTMYITPLISVFGLIPVTSRMRGFLGGHANVSLGSISSTSTFTTQMEQGEDVQTKIEGEDTYWAVAVGPQFGVEYMISSGFGLSIEALVLAQYVSSSNTSSNGADEASNNTSDVSVSTRGRLSLRYYF